MKPVVVPSENFDAEDGASHIYAPLAFEAVSTPAHGEAAASVQPAHASGPVDVAEETAPGSEPAGTGRPRTKAIGIFADAGRTKRIRNTAKTTLSHRSEI
ncbi:hypothetical protein ABZ722_33220 [Streptomyces longwoodensis]|uniref:hypothetical protein n=1 Tax=Streptomyces longwoodensis TaxID=68231 RepID=UPI0033EAF090